MACDHLGDVACIGTLWYICDDCGRLLVPGALEGEDDPEGWEAECEACRCWIDDATAKV